MSSLTRGLRGASNGWPRPKNDICVFFSPNVSSSGVLWVYRRNSNDRMPTCTLARILRPDSPDFGVTRVNAIDPSPAIVFVCVQFPRRYVGWTLLIGNWWAVFVSSDKDDGFEHDGNVRAPCLFCSAVRDSDNLFYIKLQILKRLEFTFQMR